MNVKNVDSVCMLLRDLMKAKYPSGIHWADVSIRLQPDLPKEDVDEALKILRDNQWIQDGCRGALLPGMRFSEWAEDTTSKTINIVNSNIGSPVNIRNVSNSQISMSSPGSVQEMSPILAISEIETMRALCEEILSILTSAQFPTEVSEEIRSDMDAFQQRLAVLKPKRRVIGECLHSIRSVIESAAGSFLVGGLTAHAPLMILLEKMDHVKATLGL